MSKSTHKARSQLPKLYGIKGYPREHYNADHSPKMQYKTYQSARGVARHMFQKTGEILEPYECSICGCWHLGHIVEKPNKISKLESIIYNELKVLNHYGNDLKIVKSEVEALTSKIQRLEKKIQIHYQELKLLHNEENFVTHSGN